MWERAISDLGQIAAAEALSGCVSNNRLGVGIVKRIFGDKSLTLEQLAERTGVAAKKDKATAASGGRPLPPENMLDGGFCYLAPANEVVDWVNRCILDDDGPIHNTDHLHLDQAHIGYLWASNSFAKQGRTVIGHAEQVMIRAGGWQKARQEQQLREWFGYVPDFLITLAADYCAQCSDLEFCALVEHELYHIGQELDDFGSPKFTKEGLPKLALRGHDVEEFVGVVRRYGANAQVTKLMEAAKDPAKVSRLNVAQACGTCLFKTA